MPSRLAVLRSVAAALGGATHQAEVAEAVLRAVGDHLGTVTASVWLLTPDRRELYVAAQHNAHPQAMARFGRIPADADLPGPDVVRTGEPWFVSSRAERDQVWPAVAGTPSPSEALVVLPLATGSEPIGVLSFGFPEPRAFDDDDDRTVLLAIADQCAIALDRARLYEGLRADAEAHHLLARISSVGDLDDWTRLADRVVRACVDDFVDLCALYLQEGTVLQRVALASRTYGDLAAELIGRFPTPLSADAPPAVAFRTGHPAELPPPRDSPPRQPWLAPEYARRIEGVRPGGGWAVPLRHGDRTFGAMLFAAPPGEGLDERALTLAEQVAERTAALLQSATVFAERAATLESVHGVLVPPVMPTFELLDIGVSYVPYTQAGFAGGDWWDVVGLPDGRVGLGVGDVAGHGVPALTVMGQLRNAMRSRLVLGVDPATTLEQLSRFLDWTAPDAHATAIAAVLDPTDGTLEWAAAGHPPPLLVGADGVAAFLDNGPGLPLGVAPGRRPYANRRATVPVGGIVHLYTDGLVESRQQHLDEGMAELAGEAASPADERMQQRCERLLARLVQRPEDDICLLVARRTAAGAGPG